MIINLSYSVAIRTLGNAGEKYINLLKSIENQTVKPKKIIVVLPEGYEDPSLVIGNELFLHSPKGMIIQRLYAIDFIDSKYILFCDDDMELEPDFVEKLLGAAEDYGYDSASGPLFELFPPNTLKYKLASALGGSCVMLFGKKRYYTKILSTGGWSYNYDIDVNEHRIYEAESLSWGCFLISTNAMRSIHFEDEMWFEKFGYSAFEDRGMFYKLLLNGYKTCVVSDAKYIHNDAKSSTSNINNTKPDFCRAFNHYVFWHRYLYANCNSIIKKIWLRICINYYVFMSGIYSFLLYIIGKETKESFKAKKAGFKEAIKFVKSEEYKRLNPVEVRNKNEN